SAEICEHFGLEFDEIDTTWFPQPAWDTPDQDEESINDGPAPETDPSGPRDPAELLGEIEQLLDPLRTQPPEDWENDACFSVTYGLAEALGVPLATDDDPPRCPTSRPRGHGPIKEFPV